VISTYPSQPQTGEESALDNHLRDYCAWVRKVTAKLVIRGVQRDGHRIIELPLNKVYVPVNAEYLPTEADEFKTALSAYHDGDEAVNMRPKAQRLELNEFLALGKNIALIGAPGSGKTTVLLYIDWVLSESLTERDPSLAQLSLGLTGVLPVPMYVPLSLYPAHRKRFETHPDAKKRHLSTFINDSSYLMASTNCVLRRRRLKYCKRYRISFSAIRAFA
jgi:hypothetical protein